MSQPQLQEQIIIRNNAIIYGPVVGVSSGTLATIVQAAQIVTSPCQLRAPLPDFVGRAREAAQLIAALHAAPPPSES